MSCTNDTVTVKNNLRVRSSGRNRIFELNNTAGMTNGGQRQIQRVTENNFLIVISLNLFRLKWRYRPTRRRRSIRKVLFALSVLTDSICSVVKQSLERMFRQLLCARKSSCAEQAQRHNNPETYYYIFVYA